MCVCVCLFLSEIYFGRGKRVLFVRGGVKNPSWVSVCDFLRAPVVGVLKRLSSDSGSARLKTITLDKSKGVLLHGRRGPPS